MKIDILLLEEDPSRFKKVIEIFQVRALVKELQSCGIFPEIITSLDQVQPDTYYLLILSKVLPSELLPFSPSILVLGGSLTDVFQAAKDFHFAGVCRLIYYQDRHPFIFGHPIVGKALDIVRVEEKEEVDHGRGEVFTLLRPKDSEQKRLVPFLLEYLKMYDQMGLKHRTAPIVKR